MPATEAQDLPYFGAIVELDKAVYNWTDGVWIVVTAPNFNSDPNKIDYIGDKSDSRITITSTNGKKLDFYKLEENGVDIGVFTGHVLLTGFSHDVDGDGTDDPIMNIQSRNNVNQNITGDTSGKGPWDGRMKAEPGNGITVRFSEAYSGSTNTHEASAIVEFWIAELSWQSYENKIGEPATITVVDADMNLGFFNRDSLSVHVYSDSDAGGFQLLLTETEILDEDGTSFLIQNSGIFEGQIILTDCSPIDQQKNICTPHPSAKVFAKPGDAITVEYTDCTLPQPFNIGECVTLASEAKISTFAFSFENARVVDEFGEPIAEVIVGQQIQIATDIMNRLDKKQSFAYVLLVQDLAEAADVYVALEWTEGSLNYLEEVSPALPWTPSAPGSYTVTLAVWVSSDDPTPLAPLQIVDIDVIAKTPEPVTAIPEWIKNNAGWWADGQIDDSSFLQGIQFLIKEGIMVIPPAETSGSSGSEGVPAWIKNNAGWWADGQIDDSSFLQGIQYLVKEGIIKVS